MMPIRQGALSWIGGQVSLQPGLLSRPRIAATYFAAVAVDGDDVPGAHVIAVITFGWIAGRRPKIAKIPAGIGRQIFVVSNRWMCAAQEGAPGRVITIRKICRRSIRISIIAQG